MGPCLGASVSGKCSNSPNITASATGYKARGSSLSAPLSESVSNLLIIVCGFELDCSFEWKVQQLTHYCNQGPDWLPPWVKRVSQVRVLLFLYPDSCIFHFGYNGCCIKVFVKVMLLVIMYICEIHVVNGCLKFIVFTCPLWLFYFRTTNPSIFKSLREFQSMVAFIDNPQILTFHYLKYIPTSRGWGKRSIIKVKMFVDLRICRSYNGCCYWYFYCIGIHEYS